jgi:hypothetical protein
MENIEGYYNDILNDKYNSKYTYKDKYDETTNTNNIISVSCKIHKMPFKVSLKEHLDGRECPTCTLRGYNNVKIGDKIGPYNIELMSNLFIKQYVKGKKYIFGTFKCNNCGELYNSGFGRIKNGDTKVCKKCSNVVRKIYSINKIGRLWYNIKRRCYNKKSQSYKNYGAIGITMSDDWLHYPNFEAWVLEQVGGDVSKLGKGIGKVTLDRKNPYLGYSESNCRFSSPTVQSRNIRYNLNLPMGYMGVDKSFFKVAYKVKLAIDRQTIYIGSYPTKYQCLVAREDYIEKHNLEHSRFPYTVVPEILDFSYNDLKINKITQISRRAFELFVGCYLNKANIPLIYRNNVAKHIVDLNEIVKVIESLKYTFDSSKYYYVCETFYNGKLIINAHLKELGLKKKIKTKLR